MFQAKSITQNALMKISANTFPSQTNLRQNSTDSNFYGLVCKVSYHNLEVPNPLTFEHKGFVNLKKAFVFTHGDLSCKFNMIFVPAHPLSTSSRVKVFSLLKQKF